MAGSPPRPGRPPPPRLATLAARATASVLPEVPVEGSRPPLMGLPADLLKPVLTAVVLEGSTARAGAGGGFLRKGRPASWVRALEGLLAAVSYSDPSFCTRLDLSRSRAPLHLGLLPGCRNLCRVALPPGGRPVGDGTLEALAQLPQLREVVAAGCAAVTDAGALALAGGSAPLETIDLSGCQLVGDRGVAALLGMPRLERLDLAGTAVTCAALAHARRRARPVDVRLDDKGARGVRPREPEGEGRPWGDRLVVTVMGRPLGAEGLERAPGDGTGSVYVYRARGEEGGGALPPSKRARAGPGGCKAQPATIDAGTGAPVQLGSEPAGAAASEGHHRGPPAGAGAVRVDSRLGCLMRLLG